MTNRPDVPDAFAAACPSRALLARVGGKWSLLVVLALAEAPMRFGALRRRVDGVSQKVLTQTLRALEDDGVIVRRVYPSAVAHVEYALCPLGEELVPIARSLKHWAEHAWRHGARPRALTAPPAPS